MSQATEALAQLQNANFSNTDVDWEQVLRLNYSVLLDDGGRYVDVGGNLGAHAVCFLQDMHASRLTIFEPIPELHRHLHDRFDHDPRVTIHHLALSNRNEETTFS